MKRLLMKCPGDPITEVLEITREEFLDLYPNRKFTVSDPITGRIYLEQTMGDEVICDSCNDDVGDDITLVGRSHVYCRRCADEGIAPYLLGRGGT